MILEYKEYFPILEASGQPVGPFPLTLAYIGLVEKKATGDISSYIIVICSAQLVL